jgi:hypothetical protein
LKVTFSIGAALLRAPRIILKNKRKSAILIVFELVIYAALMAIPLSTMWPLLVGMMDVTGAPPSEESVFPVALYQRYFWSMALTMPFSLAFWLINDAAWYRLMTGRQTGWFPYRLGRDELRAAGSLAVIVLIALAVYLPPGALIGWYVWQGWENAWAAVLLIPLLWFGMFFLYTRAAPMVPHAVLTGRWRPFAVLRRAGAIWGRLMAAYALLWGATIAASYLAVFIIVPVIIVIAISSASADVEAAANAMLTLSVVMNLVNFGWSILVTIASLAVARGIAAEAAICLDQHEKAQIPVPAPPPTPEQPAGAPVAPG